MTEAFLDSLRSKNDERELSLTLPVKVEGAIKLLFTAALNREKSQYKDMVDGNFPVITGTVDDWVKWAKSHERYPVCLKAIESEILKLRSKRLDLKARWTVQQARYAELMIIAEAAKTFLILTLKHREEQNLSSAAKAAIEAKAQFKKDVASFIQEVPSEGSTHAEEENKQKPVETVNESPHIYVP